MSVVEKYMDHAAKIYGSQRYLGRYSNEEEGPTVVCITSIHGNEPSGTIAFNNVMDQLRQVNPEFNGEVIGLIGNIKALKQEERFIDVDLNRQWTLENIEELKKGNQSDLINEQQELAELHDVLTTIFDQSQGPIIIIDLHTTSSKSTPFISINDTIRNRDFALLFNLPIILGIEEFLVGTILNYMNELGFVALGFEGGQHDDPISVKVHESAIWMTLFSCGCISEMPHIMEYHSCFLKSHSIYSGQVFDVRHRHAVSQHDDFTMQPGYENLQRIQKNELLATDKHGDVRSPKTARIFMPLYQKLGNDGFFIVRHLRFFWLWLSKALRVYDFHLLIQLLPGITTFNDKKHTIVVNQRIARFGVIDFFHLLGFRRKTKKDNLVIFEKREFDTTEPGYY